MNNSYYVYNGHRIGVSHVNKGLVCEDYSGSYSDSNMAMAVISDGHGDKNCFRSSKGAEFVCEIAIDVVKKTFEDFEVAYKVLKRSPECVILEIEKCIIEHWTEAVINHVRIKPFSDEEYSGLDESVIATLKSGQKHPKVYGCTLVMGVFFRDFWFGIHIGDGKCVVVHENGLYEQPIPWDNEGCVGNRSTSICSSNAISSFRYYYSENVPVALFVASDGVDESFDENGLNKCYFSISTWIKTLSKENLDIKMDELMMKISSGGSGDDVSVSCIVSRTKEIKKPYATSSQVAEKMEELLGMLKEAEKRYVDLSNLLDEVNQKENELQNEVEEIKIRLKEKMVILNDKKAEKTSIERNLTSIEKQLGQLIDQFQNAKTTKSKVDEYWSSLGVAICDNPDVMNYRPIVINSEKMKIKQYESKNDCDEGIEREPVDAMSEEQVVTIEMKDDSVSGEQQQYVQLDNIKVSIAEPVVSTIVLAEKGEEVVKKKGLFGNIFKKQ